MNSRTDAATIMGKIDRFLLAKGLTAIKKVKVSKVQEMAQSERFHSKNEGVKKRSWQSLPRLLD